MPNPRFNALTPHHIKTTAHRIQPGPIQKWAVAIDGVEYPVKQLVMEAANAITLPAPPVTPADFISHSAVRKLRRLGFEVRYYEHTM